MRKSVAPVLFCGILLSGPAAAAVSDPAVVELQTTLGTIAIRLNYSQAPITSANFATYVADGFFKDTLVHRAVEGFVLQGGGHSSIDGALKITRPPIQNEANNGLSNVTGTVAMARTTDPNSATSQFFVNLADNTFLDYSASSAGYAVFGKVIRGMPVARKIEALATYRELPFTPAGQTVSIDAVYANATWDTSKSRTRITRKGSGKVTSDPPGINCGSTCVLAQPAGSAIQLTATPAAGQAFGGWQGDCQGMRRTISLDTTKGNHNCTAVFTPLGDSLQ
jgi:cyclophilin family peptidyl-prolyl cis-trans isomerase